MENAKPLVTTTPRALTFFAMAEVSTTGRVREPSHAGSWYTADGTALADELGAYLRAVPASASIGPRRAPRAVIAPHAGYSYSGPAAAWAYKAVDPRVVRRVFLLGPSHHVFLKRCALTTCDTYCTPMGDLAVDSNAVAELRATGAFAEMSLSVDEDEHSLEMHLPYIHAVFKDEKRTPPLVPVLVGSLSRAAEKTFGAIFAPYLDDPANLFVVSSDFCHWGARFGYTPFLKAEDRRRAARASTSAMHVAATRADDAANDATPRIHESIEALDRRGMALIETKDADGFAAYLEETRNTVCGRHPISVFLRALRASSAFAEREVRFVRYEQSSAVTSERDSSVSYASAVVY